MGHKNQPTTKKGRGQSRGHSKPAKTPAEEKEEAIEKDPAVERGERIYTGKTIARGGQDHGHVPGATESPAPESEDSN